MGRRKNSFSKAIKHLKSTSIDEKIEMLNEIPTMNTGAIYSVVPNSTTVGFDVTTTTSETNPDYSTIDFDINGEDGKDTSGLFDNSGNSKFVSPPGDNSYILGPMSAMYYGWSSTPTRIGYIRESDRRMVNLASLSVKLTEWDGDPSKFTSYGQLTLEQALWFKDIGKKDGDSTHYGNYRAFYPGPPSGGSDAFGRYLAIIVGIPVATSTTTTTTTTSHVKAPMDQQASDNFSAIMNQLMKDKPKLSDFGSGRAGRAAYNRALREWEKKLAAAEKAAGLETENPIFNQDNWEIVKDAGSKIADTLWSGAKILAGLGKGKKLLADFIADYAINPLVDRAFGFSVADSAGEYNQKLLTSLGTSVLTGKNQEIKLSDKAKKDLINNIDIDMLRKHMTIGPTPTIDADNAVNPGKGKQNGLVKGAWGNQGGTHINYDMDTGKFTITMVKMLRDFGELDTRQPNNQAVGGDSKITNFHDIPTPTTEQIRSQFSKVQLDKFFKLAGKYSPHRLRGFSGDDVAEAMSTRFEGFTKAAYNLVVQGSASNIVHFRNEALKLGVPKSEIEKMGAGFGGYVYSQVEYLGSDIPGGVTSGVRGVVTDKAKKALGISESKRMPLSESRKKSILKNLKNPVVIPETKQKSYKVSPGKKSKTNFQGMDKLVGDVKPQKSFKKPQDMWSNGWQGYNYRLSQGKKNIVLEKIGEGKQAWNYMLNHGTTMNAKNLEEFWGKNPDFYSYFFNGKKYRPIRKEQLKSDYIVFLVDEFGVNSSMLQSELNIKLAEEDEKKIIAEYNKLNNIEPISYENDPLFKKVSKRLKKEIDYPDKPAKKGYPNEPPPKLGPDGFHPDFGKRYKYDKLDPISATTMKNAPTGNPEIDANVKKASLKSKVKEEYSDWRNEIGKK